MSELLQAGTMGLVTRELDGYFVQHEQCNSFCFISSGYSPFLVLLMRNMQTPSELIILRDSALCQHSLTVALWQECWEGRLLVLPQTVAGSWGVTSFQGLCWGLGLVGQAFPQASHPDFPSSWIPWSWSLAITTSTSEHRLALVFSKGTFKRQWVLSKH